MSLDAQTQAFLEKATAAATKPRHLMTPQEAREAFSRITAILDAGPLMADVAPLSIPVDGAALRGRLYLPSEAPGGLLIYFHGGGWVVGGVEEFDPLCREIASGSGLAVALVEYRKAPEHAFPLPLQDAWEAAQWLAANRHQWLDPSLPVFVGGDSAGANLAIGTTLLARRGGQAAYAGQLLVYPVTDCRDDRDSYVDPENQLLTNRDTMKWYWDQYAPDRADRESSLASPCREADLSGLPEAVILTAEHDVLRDEGEDYAERLRQASVPVHHLRAAGQMHGFLMMVGVLPGSRDGLDFVCGQLRGLAARARARPGRSL